MTGLSFTEPPEIVDDFGSPAVLQVTVWGDDWKGALGFDVAEPNVGITSILLNQAQAERLRDFLSQQFPKAEGGGR